MPFNLFKTLNYKILLFVFIIQKPSASIYTVHAAPSFQNNLNFENIIFSGWLRRDGYCTGLGLVDILYGQPFAFLKLYEQNIV